MEALVLFALLVMVAFVAGYGMGIAGYFRAGAALREVQELRRLLQESGAARAAEASRGDAASPPLFAEPQPNAARPPATPPPLPGAAGAFAETAKPDEAPTPPPLPPQRPSPTDGRPDLEQTLTMRWAVWLGAVALLFAGVFLVRYASEQGMLGPGPRCLAAVLLGLALLGAALVLKRSDAPPATGPFSVDQAPAALAAGGIAVLFGAAYGAGPFYDLLPPIVAFMLMATVSFIGLAASLFFGPLTAAVGIVGAFACPALIETKEPSLVGLFAYLTTATVAAQVVVRRSAWTWLGWATTAAAAVWVVIIAMSPQRTPDIWAATTFVPVVAAIALTLPSAAFERRIGQLLVWGQFATIAAAGVILEASVPSGATRLALFALTPLAIWRAVTAPQLDRLPWLAAMAGLLALYFWDGGPDDLGFDFAQARDPLAVIGAALLFAAAHAGAGLVMERLAPNAIRWSALVAAVPVATLALCYEIIGRFAPDIRWGLAGMLLAVLLAVNAGRSVTMPRQAGVHAAGAVAALALAFSMTLHDQWLTVALALTLPGLAWIADKVGLEALRPVALALAALTLAILASWLLRDLEQDRLFYTRQPFVTYGVPALAFFAAALLFRRSIDDALVATLEAGAAGTAALFVALEVRLLFGHRQLYDGIGFDEAAILMLSAAAQAFAHYRVAERTGRLVSDIAARLLGGIAALLAAALLIMNPMVTSQGVNALSLVLAYLAPAALAGLAGHRVVAPRTRNLLIGYAIVAGFAWITLQVRLTFHPGATAIWTSGTGEAEMWTWSGGWLAYGFALFILGVRSESRLLRMAALILFGLVVVKVFLFDMSQLTGLWRVASFLGLGLALIGLGTVYRRFVLPSEPAS